MTMSSPILSAADHPSRQMTPHRCASQYKARLDGSMGFNRKQSSTGGSMVGSDRLNVPAIDDSSHESSSTAKSNQCTCPLLGGVLHYVMYSEAFFAVSSAGHLCACPFCRLYRTVINW